MKIIIINESDVSDEDALQAVNDNAFLFMRNKSRKIMTETVAWDDYAPMIGAEYDAESDTITFTVMENNRKEHE